MRADVRVRPYRRHRLSVDNTNKDTPINDTNNTLVVQIAGILPQGRGIYRNFSGTCWVVLRDAG